MEKLNSNPGKFEDYQKELTALYIEFSENHHVICNAIELIFTQVKLYAKLSNSIILSIYFISFDMQFFVCLIFSRSMNKTSDTLVLVYADCWTVLIHHQKVCFVTFCVVNYNTMMVKSSNTWLMKRIKYATQRCS